jgi:flavin reductase (DIM6/NTAB) family NADH-FMN oxidoreductase RutF
MMDITAASSLLAWMNRELWLVTAQAGEKQGGLIATFVGQASLVAEAPRVTLALSHLHHTRDLVEASGCFALHLLSEDNLELVWRFGLVSGRDHDKFAGLETTKGPSGSPLLSSTAGWLDCRVEAQLDLGGRTLYVAEVLEGKVTSFAAPLTSQRLMELSPASRLAEMQRQRHLDSSREADALRLWRKQRGG